MNKAEQYIVELKNITTTGVEEINRVLREDKMTSEEEWLMTNIYTELDVFLIKLEQLEKVVEKRAG